MPNLAVNVPDPGKHVTDSTKHVSDLKIDVPDFKSGGIHVPCGVDAYDAERNVLQVCTEWVFVEK
jgi:hypothetical protein